MTTATNPNILAATTFVTAVCASGLRDVCIAPGSRSTPLTLAFAAHPDVRVHRHLDERSAGFFALGLALATDRPVALVCTSGTAVANFHPAVIEAQMSQVPLLVLSADRPPELRHSGANQTIDQIKMFGDHVLWAVDVGLPESDPPDVVQRQLQTLAARAYATANGIVKGPVHLNFPFRKPLEPAQPLHPDVFNGTPSAAPQISRAPFGPGAAQLDWLAGVLSDHPHGVIVCGPRCPGDDFPQAVAALSRACGYPLLADPLSGVRYGGWVDATAVLGAYETYLQSAPDWPSPDVVLRFGAVPTGKWLNTYLSSLTAAHRIHVRANGVWADDSHQTTAFMQADETATCRALSRRLFPPASRSWSAALQAREQQTWRRLDAVFGDGFFDGVVLADIVDLIPAGARLFVGNSLPVRHLDQYARPLPKPLYVYGNRGASGIDGNLSTGLGIAAATGDPTVIVVGDITFYHDMNGLLALRGGDLHHVTIVLLNNNGGGIFRRLPVAKLEPPFTDLFVMPHGLNFAPAAAMYGLDHVRVTARDAFRHAFADSVSQSAPALIEVIIDGTLDEMRRKEINAIANHET